MNILTGIGISREKDTLKAAIEAAKEAKVKLRQAKASLAIVFSTIEFSHPNTLKLLHNILGDLPLVGCSSFGLFAGDDILKFGIMVILLSVPEEIYFNVASIKEVSTKTAVMAGEELGDKLSYGFKNVRRDMSVIFSDGLMRDASGFIWGLQERLGKSFPLAGASASDNITFTKTFQYFGSDVFSDGACGILWGGKLNFGLGIKHGWKPLGKPRYVTKSSDNIVYEIDGLPAATIYKEYFSLGLPQLRKELKRISVFYPIGIFLPGEKEYLLRNILSIEDSGALVFQGNVPQESMIRLMIGTKESCLEAARQAAEEAKRALSSKAINFVLVFNSVSRYILLGRQANKEAEIIRGVFGKNTPIIGIFTYGEQAPLKAIDYQGRAYFHNQSIEVIAIGG